MKVLHICRRFRNAGGMERYLHDLCGLLAENGHESRVVYDEEAPDLFQIPSTPAERIVGVATWDPATNRSAWTRLEELASAYRPDLVHLHDPSNPYVTLRLQKRYPTLVCVQTTGHYCLGTKFFPRGPRPCERAFGPACLALAVARGCASRRPTRLAREYPRVRRELESLRAARSIVVCSRYMRGVLARNGVPEERIVVVPSFSPGVEAASVCPCPAEPRLLFAGRITKGKGLELLLEALARLPEATLDVVGDGDRASACHELARRLRVSERVRFLGWQPSEALSALYAGARVVVVPSVWPEPFGLVGVEAMACGRPVVAVGVGGIPEWLEDGKTGLLCEPTPESLSVAVSRLLADSSLAQAMGRRGRERWQQHFSPRAHWELLQEAYRWARRQGSEQLPACR